MSEKSLHTGDTTPESDYEEVLSGDDLENAASLGTAESFDPDEHLAESVPPVEPQRRRIVPERIHPNPIVEAQPAELVAMVGSMADNTAQ